jgi:hypothetical protein
MKVHEVKQVQKRVKRYWYEDGIAELISGGMFTLLGLYFGILTYFGEGSLVSVILQSSLLLLMIAGAFVVRWLVNTLKERLTYPRTGYVEYRTNDGDARWRRWVIVGVGMIVASVSILLVRRLHGMDSMALVTGLLVGVIFITLRGRSAGLRRFYVLGGLAIALGLALAFVQLPQTLSLALFYGLLGFAILLSGGLVLRRYLRAHPLPEGNANG